MESGGCGFTERRKDRVGPGQGWREVRGVSSGGRRSRRFPGFQLRAPAAAPSQQPSADHQGLHESLEPRDRSVMRVQENWRLEKGRPQERVRTGRRSSPDAPEPALPPKRRLLGGHSAGAPREEAGPQESRDGENWSGASSGGQRVPGVCRNECECGSSEDWAALSVERALNWGHSADDLSHA